MALNLLSNVREALDAAVEHFTTSSLDSSVISEGREFFQSHLEWRVARLRDLFHTEALHASPSFTPTSTTATTSTLPLQGKKHDEQAAVTQLIERLMPSIRSAMTETLTASVSAATCASNEQTAGPLKVSADPLPLD